MKQLLNIASPKFKHVKNCKLQIATDDGTPMVSKQYIPRFQWFIRGHSFCHDARVLPLKCYDMIIGVD